MLATVTFVISASVMPGILGHVTVPVKTLLKVVLGTSGAKHLLCRHEGLRLGAKPSGRKPGMAGCTQKLGTRVGCLPASLTKSMSSRFLVTEPVLENKVETDRGSLSTSTLP